MNKLPALLVFALAAGAGSAATVEPHLRLELVRNAARKAALADVGLDHRDLYGVIHAESGWVARDGMGKNGIVSRGVAQFEPATARAVGLKNPNDAAQSVEAAARLLREAAQWSARKLEGLSLAPGEREARLREGVSIYYNVSSRLRSAWNGRNSHLMPVETQHHIRNARHGALIASRLEGGAPLPTVTATPTPPAPLPRVRATYTLTAAAPKLPRGAQGVQLPQGYIQWSRGG